MSQHKPGVQKQRHDPPWPSVVNTIAILGLFYSLPERLSPGPRWLFPAVTLLLMAAAIFSQAIGRFQLKIVFGFVMQSFITAAEAWSLVFLLAGLPDKRQPANDLLRSTGALWVSNILIFAAWYWRLDAGGPHRRLLRDTHDDGAFLFPQMTLPPTSPLASAGWKPGFVDYLFLAFSTSTAFSPTDTPVLSRWAKVVMMIQAAISLGTIAILAARGVSLL